jgi:hypothetical protein
MARPLIARSELRQPFLLYLSAAEEEQIRESAKSARLPMSTFVRRVALRKKIEVPPPAAHLDFCRRELAPLASNLNQIARACNANRVPEGIYPVVTSLAEQVRLMRLHLVGAEQGRAKGAQ